jgi:hypothetical protein
MEQQDNLNMLLNGNGSGVGNSGEANMGPRQLVLIDADVAGKDAAALGRVAKTIAGMSPSGQRAALCWLVGYFDVRGDSDDE